jgi:hypothetical protein
MIKPFDILGWHTTVLNKFPLFDSFRPLTLCGGYGNEYGCRC